MLNQQKTEAAMLCLTSTIPLPSKNIYITHGILLLLFHISSVFNDLYNNDFKPESNPKSFLEGNH